MNRTIFRSLVALVCLASLSVGAASPAFADNGKTLGELKNGTPTSTSTVPAGDVPPDDTSASTTSVPTGSSATAQYTTLSAALLEQFASASNMDLDAFLVSRPDLGARFDDLTLTGTSDFSTLNAKTSASLFSDLGGDDAFDQLATRVANSLDTPDGATIATGVAFANQLSGLQVPELTMPGVPNSTLGAQVAAAGPEQLAFGLFYNSSIANFVKSSPDVFAQVQARGLNDPKALGEWNKARAVAVTEVAQGPAAGVLSPCQAATLSSMASGSLIAGTAVGGDECRPCAVAGTYMHGRMNSLFNPQANTFIEVEGDGISPYEWSKLSDWEKQSIYKNNPGLEKIVKSAEGRAAAGGKASQDCQASSAGTSKALTSSLSGVLGRLGG